jgi:hypothetical protein
MNVENLKIESREPNSNPRNNESFHPSNQKHNKKLMKKLSILLNLPFIYCYFQNHKLKCQIKIFQIILIIQHINAKAEKILTIVISKKLNYNVYHFLGV